MLPSSFHTTCAEDFIGPARKIAVFLNQLISKASANGEPVKILLLGAPGIGKSDLALHCIRQLQVEKWNLNKFNGTQLKIDRVEELAVSYHLTNTFGGYRTVWIEEVDQVPTVAQVRFLTLLDDLPKRSAIIATSNCKLQQLEERFQRRFTCLNIEPPTKEEITQFLIQKFGIKSKRAADIATFACGNVGQALMDATAAVVAA